MEENRSHNGAASVGSESNKTDATNAKRKRMMLAEVYVHKLRKLETETVPDDKYEVYHIYEFDENDLHAKITPKLSTNCTEPGKIIDVLQNSTGSDTPQLQRLIEKLCAQSEFGFGCSKWFAILQFHFQLLYDYVYIFLQAKS